jgi:outer membrane lipoprotein-sorting protein
MNLYGHLHQANSVFLSMILIIGGTTMKKYFCLLFLLIITLSACTMSNSPEKTNAESEMEPLFSDIKALFEEVDNRSFDISFPIKIEGEDF